MLSWRIIFYPHFPLQETKDYIKFHPLDLQDWQPSFHFPLNLSLWHWIHSFTGSISHQFSLVTMMTILDHCLSPWHAPYKTVIHFSFSWPFSQWFNSSFKFDWSWSHMRNGSPFCWEMSCPSKLWDFCRLGIQPDLLFAGSTSSS